MAHATTMTTRTTARVAQYTNAKKAATRRPAAQLSTCTPTDMQLESDHAGFGLLLVTLEMENLLPNALSRGKMQQPKKETTHPQLSQVLQQITDNLVLPSQAALKETDAVE